MAQTLFFYDLETSGLNARQDRVMQFAGQRTDMDLNPIGEPINELVRMTDDTLPSPDALLVTGITPQQTVQDGYTEAEFAKLLTEEVFTENTIVIGFNNIRFDDEFIRHLLWRNFYDPYEWAWRDGRSRWDMLDVIRMTRALRPDGIEWPVNEKGVATNRLELLTAANGIKHDGAHDALSDVNALIDVTRLVKKTQPKLFEYLFKMRDKNSIKQLVNLENKQPFVYASGRYDNEHHKTTVAFSLAPGRYGNTLVYDLRYDPAPLVNLSQSELESRLFASWDERQKPDFIPVPVKELAYNKAPAVAPLGVLESDNGWQQIGLTLDEITQHKERLLAAPHFAEKLRTAFESRPDFPPQHDAEAQLYDGFVGDRDKLRIEAVRNADERTLSDFHPTFSDERLVPLLLRYKARNYPGSLSDDEQIAWQSWRTERIKQQLEPFVRRVNQLAKSATDDQQFILDEVMLWAESIMPEGDSEA